MISHSKLGWVHANCAKSMVKAEERKEKQNNTTETAVQLSLF